MLGVETARTVLVNAPAVTALVPASRIEPVHRAQALGVPAIVLTRVSLVPSNHLRGDGRADANRVQLDIFAATYAGAIAIASACRDALVAAGHSLQLEVDDYEPDVTPNEFRVTQDYSIWT